MRLFFTALLICSTIVLSAQNYLLGGLRFTSAFGTVTSGGTLLNDSVTIGFNAITPKSLLFVKGKVTFNNALDTTRFYLNGPFSLYAKVGTGAAKLLWYYPGSGTVPVSIHHLTTDGIGLVLASTGDTLPVSGVPFRVSTINLTNKPVSAVNNSVVVLGGQLEFPQIGGALIYPFEGQQKVIVDETGWSAPDFIGSFSGTYNLMGNSFLMTNFQFKYISSQQLFRFDDTLSIIAEGKNIRISPIGQGGLDFTNGVAGWTSTYAVSDPFYLYGAPGNYNSQQIIQPKALYLKFNPSDSSFIFAGSLTIPSPPDMPPGFSTDDLNIQLGDTINPFTSISKGKIRDFDKTISLLPFSYLGAVMDFDSGALHINLSHYNGQINGLELYGHGTCSFPNDTALSFHAPGKISFTPSYLTDINEYYFEPNLTINDTLIFTLEEKTYGFVPKAQSDFVSLEFNVTFLGSVYYTPDRMIQKNGKSWTPVSFPNNQINITQGGRLSPQSIPNVTPKFNLEQMQVLVTSGTLGYNAAKQKTSISGNATLKYGNQTFNTTLADASHSGILLDANDNIEELDVAITGSFVVDGWSFQAKALTLQYDKQSDQFKLFGAVTVQLEDNTFTGDLGNETMPGMWLDNGMIKELNIAINSDIRMSKIEFKTNELGLVYTQNGNDEKFVIHGTALVKELWSIQATLGDPAYDTTGLEIIVNNGNAKVKLDDLEIKADNINLEGITFKEVDVRFSDVSGDYHIGASVTAVFPAGFEIDGSIAFDDDRGTVVFDTVLLAYTALGNNEGIEIPGTGVSIVAMQGGIYRIFIDNSESYKFTGSIGLDFGGQFSLDGHTVQMLHIEGDVVIDKDHLNLKDQMSVAAYQAAGSWNSILGEGEITIDLNWSTGVYSINGNIDFPSGDAYVTMDGEALYKTTGLMDAELNVGLRVPHHVPFIGGDHIGSVSGAIRYNEHDLSNSWAAGWLRVSYLVGHTNVGIKYSFGSKGVSTIGSGTINNITATIKRDEGPGKNGFGKTVSFFNSAYTIELDGQSHTCFVHMTPDDPVDISLATFTIVGPDNKHYPISGFVALQDSSSFKEVGTLAELGKYYNNNLVPDFMFYFAMNSIDSTDYLTKGQYIVSVVVIQEIPDSFNFNVKAMQSYLSPVCEITTQPSVSIQPNPATLEISTELFLTNDSLKPQVLVYYDKDNSGYDGFLFGTYPIQPGKTNLVDFTPIADSLVYSYDTLRVDTTITIIRNKHAIFPVLQNVYLYAVVEDGINLPAKSPYTGAFSFISLPAPLIAVDTAFKPGKLILSDSMRLYPSVDAMGDVSGITYTLYYDIDSAGYNGVPVKGLTDIPADDLPGVFWFHPGLENNSQQVAIYFYAIATDTLSGNRYIGNFTKGYLFGPNIMAAVTYNDSAHTPARRIGVVIDENGDGKYQQQEYQISTDNYGRYNCDAPAGTWLSVFLTLSDTLKQYNSIDKQEQLVYIDAAGTVLQVPNFHIDYPSITGVVKYATGIGDGIKIYADLNNNSKFDVGTEPYTTSNPDNGSFVLMNVFGNNVNIRPTGSDEFGRTYTYYTVDNPVTSFDDRTFHTINMTLFR